MAERTLDLDAYLERVKLSGPVKVNEEGLEALHRAQVYSIPFENFDILLGRGIALAPSALVEKLVEHRRGGYCFELNGLFRLAAEASGFEVQTLLARVHTGQEPSARTHQIGLVELGGRDWLVDVGFGKQSPRAPMPFELERQSMQDGVPYRVVKAPPWGFMLQSREAEEWQDLYSFDLGHVTAADIECGNHLTSTHLQSFFTQVRIAALAKPDGRVSLLEFTLRTESDGVSESQELLPGESFVAALESHFGIELGEPYEAIKPLQHRGSAVDEAPARG